MLIKKEDEKTTEEDALCQPKTNYGSYTPENCAMVSEKFGHVIPDESGDSGNTDHSLKFCKTTQWIQAQFFILVIAMVIISVKLQGQISHLTEKMMTKETSQVELQKMERYLEDRLAEHKTELSTARQARDTVIKDLQAQIHQLSIDHDSCQSNVQTLQHQNSELNQTVQEHSDALLAAQEDLISQKSLNAVLSSHLQSHSEQINDTKVVIEDLQAQIHQLSIGHDSYQSKLQTLQHQNSEINQTVQEHSDALLAAQEDLISQKSLNAVLNSQLQQLTGKTNDILQKTWQMLEPPFQSSIILGGDGGDFFDDGCYKRIIEITINCDVVVDNIGLQYQDGVFLSHGGKRGGSKTFTLRNDEHINEVTVQANDRFVVRLGFKTNLGRTFSPCEGNGDWYFNAYYRGLGETYVLKAPGSDYCLRGVKGRAGSYFNAFGVNWGPVITGSS